VSDVLVRVVSPGTAHAGPRLGRTGVPPKATPTPARPTLPTTAPTAGPLSVERISASATAPDGRDSASNPARHAIDGLPDTAWRVAGPGACEWLLLEFSASAH
jgi:hypothetical protein